jgi:hypothetical protein
MSGSLDITNSEFSLRGHDMKKVFLFSGKISSGKNQFAEYVSEIYSGKGAKVISDLFAADLKAWSKDDFKGLADVLNTLSNQLRDEIYRVMSNRKCYGLPNDGLMDGLFKIAGKLNLNDENFFEKKTDISRSILQIYGTQIFRNRVDDNFWIKRTKERIINYDADIVLITDVRFPNEIDFIADTDKYQTFSVRINRPIDRTGIQHEHISEKALDDYKEFSYVIDNHSSLEEFKDAATCLVEDVESLHKED